MRYGFLGFGLLLWIGLCACTSLSAVEPTRAVERSSAPTAAEALAPDIAVARALTVAQEYALPYGGLRGKPTKIYGKVMTYAEANELILAGAIDPNSAEAELADKQVWLVLFNGDIVEHVPAGAGGDPPEKEVQHSQMTIVLDAFTGEMMRGTLLSPQKEFDVQMLSALAYPGESSFEAFPPQPMQTEEPLPPATESAQ